LLKLALTGNRPAHVNSGYGWTSVFYDGPRPSDRLEGAKAVLLDHTRLAKDRSIVLTWNSPSPQHGMAVPLGGNKWVVTSPNPAYAKQDPQASSLANGLRILDAANRWEQVAAFDGTGSEPFVCNGIHGHAALDDTHVFGCKERSSGDPGSGALFVLRKDPSGQWNSSKLAYPDDRRASTIVSHASASSMVANYGLGRRYDALIRIDPKATELPASADVFTIPDGQAACQFEIAGDGRRVVNLLADGTLRVYEMKTSWKEVARVNAVAAFDCGFGAATPRPALGVDGDSVFVTDPVNRRIREFNVNMLGKPRDMRVDGMPEALAVRSSIQ
jgi:hypothetical protein